MARARNIKPSFFLDEDLVELPFSTRLLFIGLWTLADREGRLHDKPRQIKMAIFPGDEVDVSIGLTELERAGFLCRYDVRGEKYIVIVNFTKHQNPHVKEAASTIPAPVKHRARTVQKLPLTDSLLSDSPLPEAGGEVESPKPKKPSSLPTSVEFEINVWLDAVAPLTGARDRRTMANPKRWREVVEKAAKEGHDLTDFLKAVESEVKRNKSTPQYFTPEAALKTLQLGQIKTNNGFVH